MSTKTRQDQIALVLDFDGTVSPEVMLNPVFDSLEIAPTSFWDQAETLFNIGYDREIAYLQALKSESDSNKVPLSNNRLRTLGRKIAFYPGFPGILPILNELTTSFGYNLKTYVITAGLEELVLGSQLSPFLSRCWGCRYAEDSDGKISHPTQIVTSAGKVEKLYLIKRQLLDHRQTILVNYVESREDIVPWNHLIYVADGATDVPAFEVVRRGGGTGIGVYDPNLGHRENAMISGRTDIIVPADYTVGSILEKELSKAIITSINS